MPTSLARRFFRGAAGTGVAVAARGLGALALNKLLAVYGGAGGLTQLAQFQNLLALLTALPADGVQAGATARLAPLRPGSPRYRAWLGAALWLTALAVGLGALLMLGLGAAPLRALAVGAGALAVAGQALLGTALLAAGRRRAYVGLAVGLAVLGPAAVALALAWGWPLPQVLLAYLGGQALVAPLALGLARRAGLLAGLRVARPSRRAVAGLFGFLLMAGGGLLFGRAVDYAVRAYLMAHFAPAATDLWQAVAKLGDQATLVVGAVLSTVYYPQLAALASVPARARRYVRAVALGLALALTLGFGLLYGLRGPVLALLFAPRLAAAAGLLAPQLLGDAAKLLSWVFFYPLLMRGRPGPYLAVQAASAALYAALLAGLLPRYGLYGALLAHAWRHAAVLLLSVLWRP